MALTLGDAVLYLKSNNKGLDKGLNDAETKTKGWAGKMGGTVGKLVGGAVVGGAVLAVGAIAGIGTAAFNISSEVDAATKKMQSSFGLTAEEANKLGDVAVGVFKNNFAGSITEAAEAVGLVKQQLGGLVDETDLQGITEDAFRLKDAFGTDVTESVSAAKTLMENFGISSDKAFDLLAEGNQRGLNRAGDLIDTIEEYSTQFASGGASAEQFFGLLQTGLAGGALGTDKAADAFKEFRVRIQDGSDTTKDALNSIGIDADKMAAGFADGSITAAEAFDQVTNALWRTEDANVQFQAGVGLLGTQFEDLGAAALGLELIPDAFEDIGDAVESLDAQYNTLGQMAEGFKRQFLVSLEPLGDELLKIANDAMPYVQVAFDWMSEKLPGIISGAVDIIRTGVAWITKLFSGELTSGLTDGLGAFQFVKDWIDENMPLIQETIQTVLDAIMQFWDEHGEAIMEIVKRTFDTIMLVVDTMLKTILGIIRTIMLIINGDWEGAWAEIGEIVSRIFATILTVVGNQLQSMVQLILAVGPAMWSAGTSLIGNLWAGISSGFDSLITNTKNKLKELRDLLPFSEPKDPTSPLRGLGKSGESIIGQLQAGMDRAALNINGLMPAMSTAGAGATYGATTINIYGVTDASGAARAVDNTLDARRRRGM